MIDEEQIVFKKGFTDKGKNIGISHSKFWKVSGVYIIKVGGVIRYVGRSGACLYRGCLRHFQDWCSKPRSTGQMDTHYDRKGAEVCLIETEDFENAEIFLTHQLNPTDNRFRFGLPEVRKQEKVNKFRNPNKEAFSSDYDLIAKFERENNNY